MMYIKCEHLEIWLEFSISPTPTVVFSRDGGSTWGCHKAKMEDGDHRS